MEQYGIRQMLKALIEARPEQDTQDKQDGTGWALPDNNRDTQSTFKESIEPPLQPNRDR